LWEASNSIMFMHQGRQMRYSFMDGRRIYMLLTPVTL
jgi:hypothetical protein